MPVSSWGRWLPSSFIFRLSSASWDRYFCNDIKDKASLSKLKIFYMGCSMPLQSSHTLPESQKARKDIEAPFWWKFKPGNIAVAGKVPEHMESLRNSVVYSVPQGELATEPGGPWLRISLCNQTSPFLLANSLLPYAVGQELTPLRQANYATIRLVCQKPGAVSQPQFKAYILHFQHVQFRDIPAVQEHLF